jgi:hypothetical protein
MFKPKFQILLKKENFYPDEVVCLGSQLITIVDFIKIIQIPHIWYSADVDAFGKLPSELGIDSFFMRKIGDDSSLIQICSEINQFLSGVFFAIDAKYANQKIDFVEVGTEDEKFRPMDIDGVLIEIRAFDTSFFELYSDNEIIIKKIAEKFNVEIIIVD